tara:strand:+ start:243 stop:734 length:492 start_codon:yes stop_codon:yes gene_type:complete
MTDPIVGVIMGSQSDWPTMKNATSVLNEFKIPFEVRIVSAHRTPERLFRYGNQAKARGLKVIIAGAGGAAHLPGMIASKTAIPVIGVPIKTDALSGVDSLYSIVQMPKGVAVATMAIGKNGAHNAALFAISILGIQHEKLLKSLEKKREEIALSIPEEPNDNV